MRTVTARAVAHARAARMRTGRRSIRSRDAMTTVVDARAVDGRTMRAMTTRAVTTTMTSRAVTTRARSVRAVTTRARAMTVMASSSSSFPSSSSTRRRARAVARANDPSSSSSSSDDSENGSSDGSSEPNLSSSFAEELAKRRAAGASAASAAREDAESSNPFERASDAKEKAPPRFSPDRSARRVADEGDQLARSRALQSEGASSRSVSLARRLSRDADLEFSARQVSRDSPRARRNSSRSDSPLFSDSVPSSPPCPWSFVSRISSSEATSFTRATTGTDRRRSSRPRSCSANRRWIR